MTAIPAVLASWETPAWAESSEIDEAAVIHSRKLGTYLAEDDQEHDVWLLQRDEIERPTERVSCSRGSAYVVFPGGSLLPSQVEELIQMLRAGIQALSVPAHGGAAAAPLLPPASPQEAATS